jgi:hypothetical protein
MTEIWKNVNVLKYNLVYQVSTFGNIRRILKNKFRYLKLRTKNGYYVTQLSHNNIQLNISINRLVALTFILTEGDINKLQVNHINGNKLDNNINNLEWVSPQDNTIHAYKTGLRKTNGKRIVIQYNSDNTEIKRFNSVTEAETELNITNISRACRNKLTAGGYKWLYEIYNKEVDKFPEDSVKIKDFDGYFITKSGTIYSTYRNRYIQIFTHLSGYCYVNFTKTRIKKYVHCLVAKAFLEKPEDINKKYVNHIDKNKSNNTIENLEYITHSENILHSQK